MKIRGLINRLDEHMIEIKYRVFRKIYKNSKINQSVELEICVKNI